MRKDELTVPAAHGQAAAQPAGLSPEGTFSGKGKVGSGPRETAASRSGRWEGGLSDRRIWFPGQAQARCGPQVLSAGPQPPAPAHTCGEPRFGGRLLHRHGEGGRRRGGLRPRQRPVAAKGHGDASGLHGRLVVSQLVDPLLFQKEGLLGRGDAGFGCCQETAARVQQPTCLTVGSRCAAPGSAAHGAPACRQPPAGPAQEELLHMPDTCVGAHPGVGTRTPRLGPCLSPRAPTRGQQDAG